MTLDALDKQILELVQGAFPVVERPFLRIAQEVGATEDEILERLRRLTAEGLIRRIGPVFNARQMGYTSTLCAAKVAPEAVDAVAVFVNGFDEVTHNYLRGHRFNMWFTLQEDSPAQIKRTLAELQASLGVEFHSLPVTRIFKLDVRFDAEGDDDVLLQDVERPPRAEPVELSDTQRQVLAALQGGLEVTSRPFDKVRPEGMTESDVFSTLNELLEAGVIRRLAAVLNHHKLGFNANVMFAGQVDPEHIVEAGRWLAHSGTVSHCYERETFPGWPYNLFAMLHGRTMAQIQRTLDNFSATGHIRTFELLPTQAELKKQPVRLSFPP